jgi:hypothetical protein
MTAQAIENPLPSFMGTAGLALTGAKVYIGEPNQDPRSFPKSVYYDQAMTLGVTQPIRTQSGYLWRNGAPTRVWVDGSYSILVLDSNDTQVFYDAEWSGTSSANVNFTQAGAGALTRSMQAKERDIISVSDFANATDAANNSAGGTVIVPAGITPALPASYPGVLFDYLAGGQINVYAESGETTRTAKRILRGYNAGLHSGTEQSILAIESHPVGSGFNGPTNADYALTVSALKKNFLTSSVIGEVDGINITVRQAGVDSDGAAILANIATYGTGFMAALESQTSSIPAGVVTHQVRTQIGVCDNFASSYLGLFAIKETGVGGTGMLLSQNPASRWASFIQCTETATGVLFSVGNTGVVDCTGGYKVNGTQVVTARETGWTTGGGTPNKGAFNTATATATDCAQRILAIEQSMRAHGLIN